MTDDQFSQLMEYMDALNQVAIQTQKVAVLMNFFVMILAGVIIGYIVGRKS